MRRTNRLAVESLEGKTLLSLATPASGVVATLTAVRSTTSAGTQVVATLTETNRTNHDVTIAVGPSIDGFVATQGGKTIWASNPGLEPQFLTVKTLGPGQSFTIGATWDGRSNQVDPLDPSDEGSPLSGTFTITNELDRAARATVTIPNPATSKPSTPHVTPPKPPVYHLH